MFEAKHLNTPRVVYDDQQRLRWKWEQDEPFGLNVPDENPSSLGVFELPLRFPGQRQDVETGSAYNYSRDYVPSLGRYTQSDPIGIGGGLNTYAYGRLDPLGNWDVFGLDPFDANGRPSSPTVPGPFDILFPGTKVNADFVRAVGNLVSQIKAACNLKDDDSCYERWDKESRDCLKWTGFGERWIRACQDRANWRLRLCYRNGGRPDPDEPPVWRPD